MRKSGEKKRTEDSKLSPNKDFLLKFFTKNYERHQTHERNLRGFNFFLQKAKARFQLDSLRANKANEQEIPVCVKLLQTLLANMEENLKNPMLVPYINDTLFTMLSLIHECFRFYNEEKVLKAEQWQQIELLVDLFGYARNWQNISEADLVDMIDKQLPMLTWVDELPDLERTFGTSMSEMESMRVLAEWCTIKSIDQGYSQMFRQVLEQYLLSGANMNLQELVEKLTQKALIFKRSTLSEKLVRLFCSMRATQLFNSLNLKKLLSRVYSIDPKQRSSRIFREVLEAVKLEDFLTADEMLQATIDVLSQVNQFCHPEMVKDTQKVATILARLSGYFTEVVNFDKAAVFTIYPALVRIIYTSQGLIPEVEEPSAVVPQSELQADRLELLAALESKRRAVSTRPDENICTPFLHLINNFRKNPTLFSAMTRSSLSEVMPAEEIFDSNLQKFLLATVPDLIAQQPPVTCPTTSNFLLCLYLKMMVKFVNRQERIQPLFERQFQSLVQQPQLTNYHFTVCFLLVQALPNPKPSTDLLISSCLQVLQVLDPKKERLLLAHLILLASLTNQKEYPYLKISLKELIKTLLEKPEQLKEPYRLPTPSSSEALLFSKHTPSAVPDRIVELTRSLNAHTPHIRNGSQQLFYYILIEFNTMCKDCEGANELQRPQQLDTIMRMRTTNGVVGGSSSHPEFQHFSNNIMDIINNGNSIEIFHVMIRLFCVCEYYTAEQVAEWQALLRQMIHEYIGKHVFTAEELVTIWRARRAVPTHLGEFNPFINYCKDMQVVRFYCEAQTLPEGRLGALIMQTCLRLLLKLWCINKVEASQQVRQLHLLYLPVESEFLPKAVLQCPLFLVYLKMAIYNSNSRSGDKTLEEVKQSLQTDIDDIIKLVDPIDNQTMTTIKFLNFDFIKTLVDRLLYEYDQGGQLPEDPFTYRMLSKLLGTTAVKQQILEYFRSGNLLPKKLNLLFRRLQHIFSGKHYQLLENSRTIYQLFAQLNTMLHDGWFNRHIQEICLLDKMEDKAHSCHIIRQLIQLKSLVRADEQLANHIFEYVAKLTEFYGEAKKGQLLVLIPKLICELFGIAPTKAEGKQSLTTSLQILERTEKPNSCSNYGANESQAAFRCLDCEDKRLICHGCVLMCHDRHAVVFAASSPLGSRHPCQCSAIGSNPCKLKKGPQGQPQGLPPQPQQLKKEARDNMMTDFRMFRARGNGVGMGMGGFEIPPMHVQMNPMNPMNPMSALNAIGLPPTADLGGAPFSHPFRFSDYGNPFDPREDMARLERVARMDRYSFEPEFFDDEEPSGLYESINAERRLRARLVERKDNSLEMPQQPAQPAEHEEDVQSDDYSQLNAQPTKIEMEEPNTGSIIKSQSFLLQIFLQISQQMCLDRGRKASIIESENWKLNFQPPAIDSTLSTMNTRLFPPGTFKTRLGNNNDSQIRGGTCPFLARKPIAVGRYLTLVLSSNIIYILQNKRILIHLNSKTHMDSINHHGLSFECHSIEFSPNQPNQFCVAGLTNMQIFTINPEEGTISKNAAITYSNRSQYINKIQYLQIGVMLGDTKSLKLVQSKTPSLVLHGPKDAGLIKDWHILRLEDDKFTVPTYLAAVATSYNYIYTYQFDESDKGEKQFTNRINFELKKKGSGSAVHLGYLSDGRKYIVVGMKDKEGINLIGRLEPNLIDSIAPLKFQGLHPSFEKSANERNLNLGHIARMGDSPDRMVFCCTLKHETTKDTSSQAGQLALFSLSQDQRFLVQPLQISPTDSKCEGFAVLPIDKQHSAVLGMHQDGSVSVFVEGDLKKQDINAAIKQMEEKQQSKQADSSTNYEQIKKLILEKIRLPMLSQIEAQPLLDFRDRAESLKRDVDYLAQRHGEDVTFLMTNPNKIVTGLSLGHSHRVTLPTRTLQNVVEVGLTTLETLYFYSLGRLSVKLEKTGNINNRDRRERQRFEALQELELQSYKKMALGYASRLNNMSTNGEFDLFGESTDNFQSKFRKINELLEEPKQDPTTTHIKQIFLILEVFLREIRDTENSLLEREELLHVVEQFRPMLLRVDCSYYEEVKHVIELCLHIINIMDGQLNPPIGSEYEPKTFTLEPLVKDLDGQANCAYLLHQLYELALNDTQRFYFWVSRYRQLIKKLYKKYSLLLLAKDEKMKGREHEKQVDSDSDKLLCLIVASYNLLARNEHESQTLLSFIKTIFVKYGSGKGIRKLLYKYLVYFYHKRPEQWISSVSSVEEAVIADFSEPMLEEELIKEPQAMPPNELMYMDMPEQEQIKYLMEMTARQSMEAAFEMRHNPLGFMAEVEEEKQEEEDIKDIVPMEEETAEIKSLEPNQLMRDLFAMCIKAFETDEPLDTARQPIIIGYVLFKALDTVNPQAITAFLSSITKWLRGLNTKGDRTPSTATLSYLSMFSKVIERSRLVTDHLTDSLFQYAEIKKLALQRAKELIAKDPNPNKKNERVSMTNLLRNRPISDLKLSLPHSLLGLLRNPTELDPVILSLKCYWLLPKSHDEYRNERDRVIYKECTLSGDIDKMYKRAKKRPDTWRQAVDVDWLENFIAEKKPGWTQALELLALYYDS